MKHLFVIDPISQLNKKMDTTLKLAFYLQQKDQSIYFTGKHDFSLSTGGKLVLSANPVNFGANAENVSLETPIKMASKDFVAVHVRIDPPFDLNYISLTWLLNHSETKTLNDPKALRTYNEKLALFFFPEAAAPSFVSCNPKDILAFIDEKAQGDAILKPLDLFGGKGIQRVQMQGTFDRDHLLNMVANACENGTKYLLLQPFMREVFQGEVRVFTAFGEAVCWCLKEPMKGNFLANTGQGAQLKAYTPSPAEIQRVTEVARKLAKDGVLFCGMDMINGYLTEINITSPRLLAHDKDAEVRAFQKLRDIYLDHLSKES